jgi:hypothetical protein
MRSVTGMMNGQEKFIGAEVDGDVLMLMGRWREVDRAVVAKVGKAGSTGVGR